MNGRLEFPSDAGRFLKLIAAAREALDEADEDLTARLCQGVLAEAEQLFDAALAGASPLVAPMAYSVACKLAADAKESAGDRAAARTLKLRAVEKLVETVEAPRAPLALRVNCVRHLRYALMFLAGEMAEREDCEGSLFSTLVRRSRAASGRLVKLTKHIMSEQARLGCGAEPSAHAPLLN